MFFKLYKCYQIAQPIAYMGVLWSRSHCHFLQLRWNLSPIKQRGRITKRVLQVNKARSIFRKTNVSYPLIHASKRIRGFKFGKFGPLFSCDTRFEVHPFSLLPTNFKRTAALIRIFDT